MLNRIKKAMRYVFPVKAICKGFTLAEVVVVTVLVGMCMAPIVGTLNDGLSRTKDFNHKEICRDLSRSRLNEAISILSYEREVIDLNTRYFYFYLDPAGVEHSTHSNEDPHSFFNNTIDTHDVQSIRASYMIEIFYVDSLDFAEDPASPSVLPLYKQGASGLRAIVVKTTYLSVDNPATAVIEGEANSDENEDVIVSLYSLITTPMSHFHQRVYVADPANFTIFSLDTVYLNLVKVYNTYNNVSELAVPGDISHTSNYPWRPGFIAVHPSNNFMAIKCKTKIKLLNINEESSHNGKVYDVFDITATYAANSGTAVFLENPGDNDKILRDAKIEFRQDGKFLFFTSHEPRRVWSVPVRNNLWDRDFVPGATSALATGASDVTWGELAEHETDDMFPGEDGNLYIANKHWLRWYSMYESFPNGSIKGFHAENNNASHTHIDRETFTVATDRLGKKVFYGYNEGEGICEIESDPYVNNPADFRNYIYTDLNFPTTSQLNDIAVSADNKHIAIACPNNSRVFLTTNPPDPANLRPAWPCSGSHYETIVLNPDMRSFICDQYILGFVHILNKKQWAAGSLNTPRMPLSTAIKFGGGSNNVSDVATRIPEYLLVACSGGGEHSIEYVDIHPRFKALLSIPLTAAPVDIALNPAGSRVKVSFGVDKKTFDVFSCEEITDTTLGSQGTVTSPKVTYLIDDGDAKPDDNFVVIETGATQGVFAPQVKGGPINEAEPDWDAIDMVAMNDGGFLVLYRHKTVTTQRMLRWYGKIKWTVEGEVLGHYKVFASWYSQAHDFPPASSRHIAISADDSLLAISVAAGVYLYDFRAQNFDQKTQMDGLIAQYKSPSGAIESPVSVRLDSPTPGAGNQFLLNSFTASETIVTMRNYPANIFNHLSLAGIDATKLNSSMRFFGYYLNRELSTHFLGLAVRDGARMIYGADNLDLYLGANGASSGGENYTGKINVSTIPKNSGKHFQVEFTSNGGERGLGILHTPLSTAPNPALATIGGTNDTSSYCDDDGTYSYLKDQATGDWKRIPAANFQPFKFTPVRLKYITCSGDVKGIVFSRQVHKPVLFILDDNNDSIYMQPFGGALKRIAYAENYNADGNSTFTFAASDVNKIFTIAPDSSKLFFATRGTDGNYIAIVDITDIDEIGSLAATTNVSVTSVNTLPFSTTSGPNDLGRVVGMIEMPQEIKCIAIRQFNRVRIRDRYKGLINFVDKIANLNIGAVNVDGIYVVGGAEDSDGSARRHVYKYDPVMNTEDRFDNKLERSVRHPAVTSFQNMLIAFNGNPGAALADTTDWVQTYNPKDNVTITSLDPTGTPATDEVIISDKMSAQGDTVFGDNNSPVWVDASNNSGDSWMLFDHNTSAGNLWWTTGAGCYVTYDTGSDHIKLKPNRIRVTNTISPTSVGVDDYRFIGSNDNFSTSQLLKDDSVSEDTTDNEESFSADATGHRYFKFILDSNHGHSTDYGLRELKIIQNGVRRLVPNTMTGSTITNPADGTKTITISSNSETATDLHWKAFDGSLTKGWMTASIANNGAAYTMWLKIDLGMPDQVDMITYTRGVVEGNGNSNRSIKYFRFQGSNNDATWDNVIDYDGITLPQNAGKQVFYATAPGMYRYYRFLVGENSDSAKQLAMAELELFSFSGGTTPPTAERMTKTSFDASNAIKRYRAAACLTPYGPVFSGGIADDGNFRSSFHIYWPHALDTYVDNTNKSWGAMQDLPSMPGNRVDHCLVYHQGYVYRIGGSTNGTAAGILGTIDKFDFSANSWSELTPAADADNFTDPTCTFARRKAAACSHGDEIFIFGGYKNNSGSDQAVYLPAAWNPKTGRIRVLSTLPTNNDDSTDALRPINISAVPCGPYIYLIGGSTSENSNGGKQIIRYTP